MKRFMVIASLAIFGWPALAYTQTMQDIIDGEIARGAPTRSNGIESSRVLGAIALEPHYAAMMGKEMRAREVVLAPGAKILVHGHDVRPAIVYVLEGELVEHRAGSDQPLVRRQGDIYFETVGIVHWSENISQYPVRVLAVDILPSSPE